MFSFKNFLISTLFYLMLCSAVFSVPLSGSYNVGSGQTFTSLTGTGSSGFFNTVNTEGLSGNVTLYVTSNITESGSVNLNQWTGSSYTITIRPSAASVRVLSGTDNSGLFYLNGTDNLIIDGRFGGSGMYLTFRNTSTSGPTFRFINDASNNTLTYCTIEGAITSSSSGVILFSTSSGSTGNDNNTISYCHIRDLSSASSNPRNLIVSNGTTTSGRYNSDNTITNNDIYNFYQSGQTCSGILLMTGSTDFNITNNSFYQTSSYTPGSSTNITMILVNTSIANNINISGNYLGGSAANCGGSPFTFNGTASKSIYFIRFATTGSSTASSVNGNIIRNISFTSTPSTSNVIYFSGIIVESGLVNIGTTSGNSIGNNTTNGNISINLNGTASNLVLRGIDHRSNGDISNNIVGSIELGGSNNRNVVFDGVSYSSTPSSNTNVTGNTVGSASVSNSIEQTSSTFSLVLNGIYSYVSGVTMNISNNTVSNLRITSTSTASKLRGIIQDRGTNAVITINSNTVSNLYSASSSIDRYPENTGLLAVFTGSSSTVQTISGNTISGLYGTGSSDSYVQAFSFYNNLAKGTFEKNRIYNLNHTSATGSPKIWGINSFWGSWNIINNQISITNGEATDSYTPKNSNLYPGNNLKQFSAPESRDYIENLVKQEQHNDRNDAVKPFTELNDASTNGAEIKGIHDEAEFPCIYYYNSIYIGGTASSGNQNSWAYDRPLLAWATPATIRNNVFFNARTGGTGKHYAMGNEVGAANWVNTSSDFNLFVSSDINTIATWEVNDQTIQQWRVSSSGDKHTWSTVSTSVSASNLFTSVTTGNLDIITSNYEAWLVSGKGMAIAGYTEDYQGNTRPSVVTGGCTDLGSHEFTATPPSNPLATVDNAPGSGVTSNYSLWGRVLLTVEWGTGGSSYPSSLSVRYYSGVNPGGVLGGGYSNSYWQVNPVGTLTGTTYDITINFGSNETYTISSPSANTRLAKFNGTWEIFTTAGTGVWQTELNWTDETIKTRGMNSFSDYALTDGTNPLPVELCSFTASVNKRDVDLVWVTCSEINNKGFEIERRLFNKNNNDYYPWIRTGYVDGHGTVNQQQTYMFSDIKLPAGKYQYRLKQIDYNGNFEYHNLTSPQDILIGLPVIADLFQNYPNPSNPVSKVDFQIPFAGRVTLKVYDITGREVVSLIDKDLEGGFYTAEFNGSNLSSGVYFYRLIAGSGDGSHFSKTMKLILIK